MVSTAGENISNFWHLDRQKLRPSGIIYEIYNPINCLRNHQYQRVSYFKVALAQIKACRCFYHALM